MDAEMFGNLSNYPNSGMKERAGLVGEANGGVLFLDEIGELPLELQAHLLRVLDSDGEYQRLGESSLRRSDFRLLAATNRDPSHLRADFAARFKVKVELPPLSERREDIPLLVRHLVSSAALANPELAGRFVTRTDGGLPHVAIDSRLTEALLRHEYAGNIRELDAILWKAMAGGGDVLLHEPALFGPSHGSMPPKTPATSERRARNRELLKDEIESALSDAKGNVAEAAAALGLSSRYALYRLLTKHGIVTR
jgi:DNA-binding NtrC family response regulator